MHPLCPLLCVDEIEKRRDRTLDPFFVRSSRVFTADRAFTGTVGRDSVGCVLAEFHYRGPNESSRRGTN